MRFASAKYVRRQEMLDVTFENGDRILVAVESVLSKARNGTPVDWTKLRVGETGDVLEVPERGTVLEIPWDRIRSIADPNFRTHLADVSAQRARRIGSRIRTMRLEANLTRLQLAAKVGVSQETVARLETGKVEPTIDVIEHFALALGRRLQDFAEA
jgi:DNA-binding XRE family transcriptional regulator